jgi:exopolysaccharide production protein ExoQ
LERAVVRPGNESAADSAGGGPAWLVGFFFAFRLFIMILSVWVLGTDPQTGVAIGLALNFAMLGVVVFSGFGGGPQGEAGMMRMAPVRWALFFLCFSGCSLFWSGTASLAAATVFWCAMAADSAMVVLLLRSRPAAEVAPALMKGYVWGASLIAIIAWVLPAQPDLRLGFEDLLGPNQIGFLCAFAFFFAQHLARGRGGIWTAAMVLLGVTLIRSLSKTTIIALLVSQAFVLLQDRSISRRTKVMSVLGALFVVLAFWNLISSYYDVYINAGNQSESLTGRVGLWAIFLAEILQQPWIGHGFHSVWKVIPPIGPDQFEARHAHNELLQQIYAYGVFGAIMLVGLYGSFLRQVRRMERGSQRVFFLSLLLFVAIRGLADTEVFDLSLPLWAIILFTTLVRGLPQTHHHVDSGTVPLQKSKLSLPAPSIQTALSAE